jgi:cystathionine beta-lyase
MVEDFLTSELPTIKAVQGDATYLVWLDLAELHDTGKNVAVKLREKTGLYVSDGGEFGTGGEHFLRMNIACPKSICTDGLNRLKKGIMS